MKKSITLPLLAWTILSVFCLEPGLSVAAELTFARENGHPVIIIPNPAGPAIRIQPVSKKTGSIGFEINGKRHWLPDKSMKWDGSTCTWEKSPAGTVRLTVEPGQDRCRLHIEPGSDTGPVPLKWIIHIAALPEEYFTGALERVVDGHQNKCWEKGIQTGLNLRGEFVEMKVKPTISAYAPFYISSSNYGFFTETTWPGSFDFCKSGEETVEIAFEGPEFDFWLYFGTPLEIVQKHALEAGPPFCPPAWAFGPWRWRDEHKNRAAYYDSTAVHAPFNSELVEDILMMKALDIPCTAYWVDRPWAIGPRGFDDYEFDPVRFPEAEAMIGWLNGRGIEFMLWIAPWVMGKMNETAIDSNFILTSKDYDTVDQELIDFTHPRGRQWWMENGPARLARMGVRGYKLDRADGEKLMDTFDLKTASGKTYRENYNDYPRQYVEATFKAVQPILGDNFILFPRAQYTGSSRYGGLWAGDTNGRPEGLRSVIIGMQRCSIMGYPVWGSDTGGYWGDFSHETCMRWLAFSCFSPIMEVGPTNNRGFWDNPEPPHYDSELIAVWRLYAKLRMKLKPYIHALAREASETGTPIVRPLFLACPDQPESWMDWQTFMLGPDILVSAIWEPDAKTHSCYLPAGETWINAWDTTMKLEGGQIIDMDTPLYKIPVFIRDGSGIDLGDLEHLYRESLDIAARKPDLGGLEREQGWQ
ncbi:glycoside hydrolase family 31 protein [bacterium]|nr:glycoside hydrolase family 31 protein [bacterium]